MERDPGNFEVQWFGFLQLHRKHVQIWAITTNSEGRRGFGKTGQPKFAHKRTIWCGRLLQGALAHRIGLLQKALLKSWSTWNRFEFDSVSVRPLQVVSWQQVVSWHSVPCSPLQVVSWQSVPFWPLQAVSWQRFVAQHLTWALRTAPFKKKSWLQKKNKHVPWRTNLRPALGKICYSIKCHRGYGQTAQWQFSARHKPKKGFNRRNAASSSPSDQWTWKNNSSTIVENQFV